MTLHFKVGTLVSCLFAVGFAGAAYAQTDQEILTTADQHRGGSPTGVTFALSVVEQSGDSVQLSTSVLNTSFLATYTAPPRLAGQKILQRERNMWFVVPGVSQPVPISPRQKMLGAASYGDIASMRWSEDYKVAKRTDAQEDGKNYWVFELAASSDFATYDRVTLYVDKADKTARKQIMRTASGELLKTATMAYQAVQGPTGKFITEMVIVQGAANKTTLTYSNVKFEALPASNFLLANVAN